MEYIPAGVKLTTSNSGQIKSDHTVFSQFVKAIEDGKIEVPTGKVFNIDDIVAAHQLMDSNQAMGKIVVLT
jgi:NADPH:quinone reductase-like Zn-dependent oxidoreductase